MASFDASGTPQQEQSTVGRQMKRGAMLPGNVVRKNHSQCGMPAGCPLNNPVYGYQSRNEGVLGRASSHLSSGIPQQSPSDKGNLVTSRCNSSGLPSRSSTDLDAKARTRHKQQRLLLLHHSAQCPHGKGRCTVTPHCTNMKLLWRHIEACKDNACTEPHCFSSRAVLSHYFKCKKVLGLCPVCGPVREALQMKRSPNEPTRTSLHGTNLQE